MARGAIQRSSTVTVTGGVRSFLAASMLAACVLPAHALDYVFPGNLPAGCVDKTGGHYLCGALTLAAGDSLTVAAPKPATVTFDGALGIGAGASVNGAGAASDVALVVRGAVTLGANAMLNAAVQTQGAGAISVGAGSTIGGSIATQTGAVTLGESATVAGSIGTVTGYVTLGVAAAVSGSISTLSEGYVVLGASARVGGSIAVLGGGYASLGDSAVVGGSISTVSDGVTLGANGVVGGSVSVSETGAVTVGASALISGNVATRVGDVTVGAGAVVEGQISVSVSGAIVVGAGAQVYAVCCRGTDASCFADGSGATQAPQMCNASSASNFDCLETGATYANVASNPGLRNPLFTKLAGTAFTLDVAAINADGTRATGYTSTSTKPVTIEMVDGAGTLACISRPALVPPVSQTLDFSAGDGGRKTASVTLERTHENLRCRITDPGRSPSVVSCSSDSFSVRPAALKLLAAPSADAPSAKALPVVGAGAAFGLAAGTQPASGYAGILKLDTGKLGAQNPAQDTVVESGGVVGTLTPSSMVANAGAVDATYSEAGYLYLAAGAYRDDLLTLVDSANGDCISSTLDDRNLSDVLHDGRYGCSIGNRTGWSFGRFAPHHFAVSLPVLTAACAVKTPFSYFGQDGFATAFTLTAQNAGNGVTRNYSGAFARFDLSRYADYGFGSDALPAGALLSSAAAAPSGSWGQGLARVTARHRISRPVTPVAEMLATVDAAPSDGETVAGARTVVGDAVRLRYGRLRMRNAYGSEMLPLAVPLEAQYWTAGGYYVLNTDDSCTAFPAAAVVMGNFIDRLSACETQLTSAGSITFQSGVVPGTGLVLSKPGAGNAGSVDLLLNVTTQASGSTCTTVAATPAAAAQMPWFGNSPRARATFGIYRSRLIYSRENY